MPDSRIQKCGGPNGKGQSGKEPGCGVEFETSRIDTIYCKVCRHGIDLEYLDRRKRKDRRYQLEHRCKDCGKVFMKLDTKDDLYCGDHDGAQRCYYGTCAYCEQEVSNLLHPYIAVCRNCAKDPKNRDKLIKALSRKKRQRLADPEASQRDADQAIADQLVRQAEAQAALWRDIDDELANAPEI
jgi:hypothetical protein